MGHIDSRVAVVLASMLALSAPTVADAQTTPEPGASPEHQPEAQPDAQPVPQPDAQPVPQPDAQPDTQQDVQPVYQGQVALQSEVLTISGAGSPRSQASASMLMPRGSLTVGADLSFLTADAGLAGEQIRFTDVVLFRPRARYTPGNRVELFAGTTLLPKQPSFTDELAWQSANLGALIGLGARMAAFAQAGGGALTDGAGWWAGFDLGVQARKSLDDIVVLQGALGGATSLLFFDEDTEESFWFAEVAAHGEILFQADEIMAGWLGVDYRVPVAHAPDAPDPLSGAYLDPQPRVNFHLGVALAFLDDWDLYAEVAILDRGDIADPATTLPVLEGGFDQQHFVLGLLRRFQTRSSPHALLAR
ncbi:MAG TPA: PT domain-containing protein [Haliangium sp.]|nr:PT domain-containing protein [Haliangium sp.]